MKLPRHFALALLAAIVSIATLATVLTIDSRRIERRWTVQVAPRPEEGQQIFAAKGCAHCHGESAAGTTLAPPLRQRASLSSVPRLVTAMWNHAPRMWQEMQSRQMEYPSFTQQESAQLIAYLYVSGYADSAGDRDRGRAIFEQKRCVMCHKRRPDTLASGADNPLAWTQKLWNHAATMNDRMSAAGIPWPQLDGSEVRDLFAYVSSEAHRSQPFAAVSGNPENGWRVFQDKACASCHQLTGQGVGITFGDGYRPPPSFAEFGATLLNHMPQMRAALRERNLDLPKFDSQEMTDLAVFLYTLHYLEPGGSPDVGRSAFVWRGCAACHGKSAEGSRSAPSLRGRASAYTAARLASDLWKHGARMHAQANQAGYKWPALEDSDVGNLLAFLNTPPEH
jgi:mono/diheme cytochrome c family protein